MSMSKKDFIALADFVRWHNDSMVGKELPFTATHLDTLAQFCETQSERFKRDRWLGYIAGECGPNGGDVKKRKG